MKGYEKYKEVGLPWLKVIPEEWEIKPNKVFLKYQKNVVGKKADDYELLSLTKQGIQIKGNNDFSGKMPDNFESYQIVEKDQLVMCLFDLDISAVFSGLSNYTGKITSAYDVFNIYGANHRFVDYYFRYIFQDRKYKLYSKSVRYTITKDDFRNLKTPIPLLHEQEQIANFLDWKIGEIDKLIGLEKEKIQRIKEYYHRLNDSYFEVLEENYAETIKIRNFAKLQNGISESGAFFLKGSPFVNYSDVFNNDTLPKEFESVADSNKAQQEVFSVRKGDVFITRTSETVEDAASVCLCTETVDKAVFSGFLIRIRTFNFIFIDEFLLYYLKSLSVRNQIIKNLNIVTRVSLSQNLIKNITLRKVPKDIQEDVVKKIKLNIESEQKIIKLTRQSIAYLEELKQTLISDAVTGKIDVRDIKIPHIFTERRKANEFNRKRI